MERNDEIRKNYDAFMRELPQILPTHRGKFALMHHGEIVDYYDTPGDANTAGEKLFKGDVFSIQEVAQEPLNLGFLSYAGAH